MTRSEINDAIARLRKINRHRVGRHARAYAKRVLSATKDVDTASVSILACAFYHAAATRANEKFAADALRGIVQTRYALLQGGGDREEMLAPCRDCPDDLRSNLLALMHAPVPVLKSACECVLQALDAAFDAPSPGA